MKVLEITHGYYDTPIYRQLFEKFDSTVDFCVAIPVNKKYVGEDFKHKEVCYYNIKGTENKRFGLLSNARSCMDIIASKVCLSDIDLIHTHFLVDAVIAYYINKRYNIPYMTSIRGSCINGFIMSNKIYRRIIARTVLKTASKLVFISPSTKDRVVKSLPRKLSSECDKKSIIIPNGIDEFWHDNAFNFRKTLKDNDHTINVLTVASIDKNKNQLTVAKAIKELNNEGFSIKYSLVGEIKDQALFNELLNYNFIKYEGVKNKEQLISDYRESDIFVLLSFSETFGLVYAEALSQCMPILYTKGQGFDGQVDEKTVGLHVDPTDIQGIKEALLYIIDNYRSLSSNCVNASKTFDWSITARKLVDTYKGVIYPRVK